MDDLRHLVVTLGRALVARGLVKQADVLRVYLLALDRDLVDRSRTLNVHVTPSFVREWCGLLQLAPHAKMFPVHGTTIGCPACGKGQTYVEIAIPDRTRHHCTGCGLRWISLHTSAG